jgi:hypothetical protein
VNFKQKPKEVDLPEANKELIPSKTTRNSVACGNIYGMSGSFLQNGPMAPIEPVLAEFCRHLNRMAKSITHIDFLALANDIMDSGTEAKVQEFQKQICEIDKPNAKLMIRYFYNFMKRHGDILHTAKVAKKVRQSVGMGHI